MKRVVLVAIAIVGFASADAIACMGGNCGPRGGFGGGVSVTQISISFSGGFQGGYSGGCGINPCGPQPIYRPMPIQQFPQQYPMYMGGSHGYGGMMIAGGYRHGHGRGHCMKFRRTRRCGHRKFRGGGCGSGRRGGSLMISARGRHGGFMLKARWGRR